MSGDDYNKPTWYNEVKIKIQLSKLELEVKDAILLLLEILYQSKS